MNVSESVNKILQIAKSVSKSGEVMPLHLLYGCSMVQTSLAGQYLQSEGITPGILLNPKHIYFPDKTEAAIIKMAAEQSASFDHPAGLAATKRTLQVLPTGTP